MAETESINQSGNTLDWQNRTAEFSADATNNKSKPSQESVGFVPQSEVTTPIDKARADVATAIQTQREIGYGESFRAGASESATANFFDWLTRPEFTPDDRFNSADAVKATAST